MTLTVFPKNNQTLKAPEVQKTYFTYGKINKKAFKEKQNYFA